MKKTNYLLKRLICVILTFSLMLNLSSSFQIVKANDEPESFIKSQPEQPNPGDFSAFEGYTTQPDFKSAELPDFQQATNQGYLNIPTYEGSNQLTHPQVLYFADGFNGYKFWMVMTPYPRGNDNYENPSIVCSNNGIDWAEPAGIVNPVSGLPENVNFGAHYSDTALFTKDNTLELWYRLNPKKASSNSSDGYTNIICRQTSTDGIHWSDKQIVLPNNGVDSYMSPSIIYENGKYRVWYVNYGGKVYYIESSNLLTWSAKLEVVLPGITVRPWHLEVKKTDIGYELIVTIITPNTSPYVYGLYYSTSEDGIYFNKMKVMNHLFINPQGNGFNPYKSSFVKVDGYYYLYVPFFPYGTLEWRIYFAKVTFDEFNDFVTPSPVFNAQSTYKKDSTRSLITGISLNTSIENFSSQLTNGVGTVQIKNGDQVVSTGIVGTGFSTNISMYGYTNTSSIVVNGDVDGNGAINAADVLTIKRHVLNLSLLTGPYKYAGSINGKGAEISAIDVLSLKRHVLGLQIILPSGGISAPLQEDLYNLTVMGESRVTAEQMVTYCINSAKTKYNEYPKVNGTVWDLANHFLNEGITEGVRGDIAFAQSIHETKYFLYGGDVGWTQNNYAGIGATGGVPGNTFSTPQIGVRAQIQHLKAYGSPLPLVNPVVDPRYQYVTPKGKAPKWINLSGMWAVPGYSKTTYASLEEAQAAHADYGSTILKYYDDIKNTAPDSALVAQSKKVNGQ